MQALVFPDIGTKAIGSSLTTSAFSWPKIPAGDDIRLKLRLVETVSGARINSRREVSAMKISIGRQDARPTSGGFQLKLGSDPESAGVNTTATIGFDSSAEDLADKLNALTDSALSAKKNFTVAKREGSWHIRAADDGAVTFSIADNSLLPQSIVSIRDYEHDEATHYEIRLIQTPVGEQTNFAAIVPELPSVSIVQHGAKESGVKRNTIQQIFFPPELTTGYSFRLKYGFRRTAALVLPSSKEAVQAALDAIAEDGETFVVSANNADRVLVEFTGDTLSGTDVAALEIESLVLPSADIVVNLSTATDGMAKYMDSIANASTGLTEFKLPLSLTLWLIDEQDEEATEEITFIQEITFLKPVSMAAFSNAATLNPTKPLSRESYLPFSPSQVTETQRGYLLTGATALGNASYTSVTVTHNLGTRHVYVALFDSAVDGQMLKHGTDYEVEIVSDNAIKITFPSAPGIGAVVGGICTVASTNAFVDLEIEIGQVIGLEDRLSAIEETLAELQAATGSQSTGTRDTAFGSIIRKTALPLMLDAYPMKTSLLAAVQSAQATTGAGTATTTATAATIGATPASIADIPISALPRDGDILGAVHDATLTAQTTSTLPTASSGNKGSVWQNRTTSDLTIPGGGGRKSSIAKPGDFFASDGRRIYRVVHPQCDTAREFTAATSDTCTLALHGYANSTKVRVFSTGTLPAGLSADTTYYVISAASNTFQLSTIDGGSAVDITDTGTGTHYIHTAPVNTSWYPADFERDLFITAVDADSLAWKRMAEWKFGFELAMLNKKTQAPRISDKIVRARWRLKVEIGTLVEESAPSPTGGNFKRILWGATPVLDKVIFITNDTPCVFTFGARVTRTGASVPDAASFTVEKAIFGKWVASDATTTTADFFLRAKLTEWDCEDAADAEGFVILLGLDKGTAGDSSDMGTLIIK